MHTSWGAQWRRLGRTGQAFIILLGLCVLLYFLRASLAYQLLAGLVTFFLGIVCAFRLARFITRKAIWRLRNRLIAAYLFIAVVPIVLILALVWFAGKGIIGQMAVYLVDTELKHRENTLRRQVDILATVPSRDPEAAMNRFARLTRTQLPEVQLVVTGNEDLRYPPDSHLEVPVSWSR